MNTAPRLYNYVLYFVLFSIPLHIFSQNSQDNNSLRQNRQLYHDKGEYDKAIEQAKLIYRLGENTQNHEVMALALNWEGQSLLKKKQRSRQPTERRQKSFFRKVWN